MEESKGDGVAPPQTSPGGNCNDSEVVAGSGFVLDFEGLPADMATQDMPTSREGDSEDDKDVASSSFVVHFEGLPAGMTMEGMQDLLDDFDDDDIIASHVVRETLDRGTIAFVIFSSRGAAIGARAAIRSLGDIPKMSTVGDDPNDRACAKGMPAGIKFGDAAAHFRKGLRAGTGTTFGGGKQPGPKEDTTREEKNVHHADMEAVGRSFRKTRLLITSPRHVWEIVAFDVLGSDSLRRHKALRKAYHTHCRTSNLKGTEFPSTADSGRNATHPGIGGAAPHSDLAVPRVKPPPAPVTSESPTGRKKTTENDQEEATPEAEVSGHPGHETVDGHEDIRSVSPALLARIEAIEVCANVIRRSALGVAAESGQIEALRVMLDRGEDVNVSDPPTSAHRRTALHWAAFNDKARIVDVLVKSGASLQAVGKGHESPLHVAAERSAVPAARALLRHGADAKAINALGETPLHRVASTQGTVNMVKLLLNSGSDPEMEDANGRTAADVVGAEVEEDDRSSQEMDVLRQLLASAPVARGDNA